MLKYLFLLFLFFTSLGTASLSEHIHYNASGKNRIGYLDIQRDHPIDQSTYLYVKFALQEYLKEGVSFIILHLNTPGGEVFSSMKIAELLQEIDTVHHIPVVAVIDNWALSAGAMLAYSCRYIAVSKTSLMGAAEPVFQGSEGKMESAPEKIVSALRTEFASLAKFYGRNPLIAEAMVDKDIILVAREGEIVQLYSEKELNTKGKNPDHLITSFGKLLTLDAEQLLALKVAEISLPRASSIPESRPKEWPFSQSSLSSDPFFSQIPDATVIEYRDWKIDFFAFLTHPIVASLLMMGLIVGIYMETNHPGFGLPGGIALTCLALILLSNFATQAIHWLELFFLFGGILLLLIEIFILPGFGIAGVLGILLILFSLFAMMLPSIGSVEFLWNWQEWNLQALEFFNRLTYYSIALILSFVFIVISSRYITPRLFKKNRVILHTDQEGSVAGLESYALPPIGSEGEAQTSLHPGGKVKINDFFYDALTETAFIEKGEKVVVVKIQGSGIIVQKKAK